MFWAFDVREDRLEGFEVAVDVADDRLHAGALAESVQTGHNLNPLL